MSMLIVFGSGVINGGSIDPCENHPDCPFSSRGEWQRQSPPCCIAGGDINSSLAPRETMDEGVGAKLHWQDIYQSTQLDWTHPLPQRKTPPPTARRGKDLRDPTYWPQPYQWADRQG